MCSWPFLCYIIYMENAILTKIIQKVSYTMICQQINGEKKYERELML